MLLNGLCCVALQMHHQQTWTSWSSQFCVMVCAGTCRISPCRSSPLRCILRWSTRPKVRHCFCNAGTPLNSKFYTQKTTRRHRCPVALGRDFERLLLFQLCWFFSFSVASSGRILTPHCSVALHSSVFNRPETGYLWLIGAKRSVQV